MFMDIYLCKAQICYALLFLFLLEKNPLGMHMLHNQLFKKTRAKFTIDSLSLLLVCDSGGYPLFFYLAI